jgi:hypothetical protein
VVPDHRDQHEEGAPETSHRRIMSSIGYPIAGTPAVREQEKAFDCGFTAHGKGSFGLAEAEAKGEEIKTQVG